MANRRKTSAPVAGRVVPNHFQDPAGLLFRVLRSGGSHGRFSVLSSGLALLATPFDWLLRGRERRLLEETTQLRMPVILVCGAARSGTTLMAEVLGRAFDVGYITNLMAMFPRSPISASRVFRCEPRRQSVPLTSHYGRTAGFRSPNDGLPLWDRWTGPDRTWPDASLLESTGEDLERFFGALESWTGKPTVTKNNVLNLVASDVARVLPTARFICMRRDPVFLAQSLLLARRYIHGSDDHPYGLAPPGEKSPDPVEDVIRQVRYHETLTIRQLDELGVDRFRVVSYEKLCANPRQQISDLAGKLLGLKPDLEAIPESFTASRSQKVDDETFERLVAGLGS
jgi:LPS sulfotransferase NodH